MVLNQLFFKYGVYYPVVFLRRQNVPRFLRELLVSQYSPSQSIRSLQLDKLNKLVKYAGQFVPHYNKHLVDISVKDIAKLSDIVMLPCATKELIKENTNEFISTQSFRSLTKKTTGGSTGEPLTIWKTSNAMAQELAATWRGYTWAGVDMGDRQGRFWGVPFKPKDKLRATLVDYVTHRKRCSAFSFGPNDLKNYTNILLSFNPKYFYGYVSMLTEYAEYLKKNYKKSPFNLQCIITTAEVLSSSHRALLEEVFDTKVFNEYGSGELGSVAHECEKGSMHVMSENMIVEVLDGHRVCKMGEIGELVITELNNRAMPLIRYRTGDFASFSDDKCSCGISLPVIKNLYGRAYDMIKNKDGRLFHGEFFMYIFEGAKRKNLGIGKFQVIQKDVDKFVIKIKPENGYSEQTQSYIRNRIQDGFDKNAIVNFEEVHDIPRAPSGKMRLIIGIEN